MLRLLCCLAALFTYSSGLKCLTCISNAGMDLDCEHALYSGQAASQECKEGDQCLVTFMKFPGNNVVNRKCCSGSDCMNKSVPTGNGLGMWYQSCDCDNCNSFDPSTGSADVCKVQKEKIERNQEPVENDDDVNNIGSSPHTNKGLVSLASILVIIAMII